MTKKRSTHSVRLPTKEDEGKWQRYVSTQNKTENQVLTDIMKEKMYPQKLSDSKELAVIEPAKKALDDPSRYDFDCLVLCRNQRGCEFDGQGIKEQIKLNHCFRSMFGWENNRGEDVKSCRFMKFGKRYVNDEDYPYPKCMNRKPSIFVPTDRIIRDAEDCITCSRERFGIEEQARRKKIDRMDRSDDGRPSDYRSVDWYPKR